eukprot:scaffold50672_cov18-Prasinocladus_malaysianus.AAC.1
MTPIRDFPVVCNGSKAVHTLLSPGYKWQKHIMGYARRLPPTSSNCLTRRMVKEIMGAIQIENWALSPPHHE